MGWGWVGKNGLEGVRMAWGILTPEVRMGYAIFTLGGKNGLGHSCPGVRMRGGNSGLLHRERK